MSAATIPTCRLRSAAPPGRRTVLSAAVVVLLGGGGPAVAQPPQARWFAAADAMRRLAESWGDQSYGAVLVRGDAIVGHGPSRVVQRGDPEAHAEREAIRDAIERHGPDGACGAVLYSTSRPCPACERAAARAGVARMVFGPALTDAGAPRAP